MKAFEEQKIEAEICLQEALTGLFALKLKSGGSVKELHALANSCIHTASCNIRGVDAGDVVDAYKVGSMLRSWHREATYLESNGNPRALPLAGKVSLKSLSNAYFPRASFPLVLRVLRSEELIKNDGHQRWLPTMNHARLSKVSHESLRHISEGVSRFVRTATRNLDPAEPDQRLFEQACRVPNLPARDAPAFRQYVRQQAFAFLTTVNDWLELRAVKQNSRGKKVVAGAFAFAFLDTPVSSVSIADKRRKARTRRA